MGYGGHTIIIVYKPLASKMATQDPKPSEDPSHDASALGLFDLSH